MLAPRSTLLLSYPDLVPAKEKLIVRYHEMYLFITQTRTNTSELGLFKISNTNCKTCYPTIIEVACVYVLVMPAHIHELDSTYIIAIACHRHNLIDFIVNLKAKKVNCFVAYT